MNFLNPVILLGLSLAALPIIIHFFTRAKSKTIKFGTLRFLKELQQKQIRRLKLRQLLLLLLRTLIIVLLVLGFARPSLKSTTDHAGANTSMAIILDTSYSMEAQANLLPQAKSIATQILSVLNNGDQVYILSTSDTLLSEHSRAFHNIEPAYRKIKSLEIQNKALSLPDVVAFAENLLLHSANVNKELYIISDFQATAVTDSIPYQNENVRRFALPLRAEKVENLAIDHLDFVTTIIEKKRPLTIRADISNTSQIKIENALVQIFINDQRVAQTALDIDANASLSEDFNFTAEKSGLNHGYLELEDDAILRDNRFYFTFRVPEQIRVALFTESPFDARYLQMLLDPQIAHSAFQSNVFSTWQLAYTDFTEFDVVFIAGAQNISEQATERLNFFVRNGGGLIVAVDSQSDLDLYNQYFMPALELPLFKGKIGNPNQNATYFSIRDVDFDHPIFSGVFEKQNTDITRPLYFYAAEINSNSDVQNIMTFSNNAPYLFEKALGSGKILFFTSGFAKNDNDLPLRTLFAPLVTRCITFAGAENIVENAVLDVGDVIQSTIAFADASQTLEIFRPDGMYDRVAATVQPLGAFVTYAQTDQPGIYTLEAKGNALAQWAVNLDTKESRIQSVSDQDIQDVFSAQLLDHNADLADDILTQRYGAEIWLYFILAAFVLLCVEMLIFRTNKNKLV